MDWFSWAGNLASIAGLIVTAFALHYAKTASEAARAATKAVRKANASEVLDRIGHTANLLQGCVENDQKEEAVLRARDLISDISRYKLRYDRFLDTGSKARLDEAKGQISVISRSLATKGVPTTSNEKNRLLRICHEDVVAVLNEESARIIVDLPPKARQLVRTQNPLNGGLSHGIVSQAVHQGVQVGRRTAAGTRHFDCRNGAGVGSESQRAAALAA